MRSGPESEVDSRWGSVFWSPSPDTVFEHPSFKDDSVVKGFFQFLSKAFFGKYDEMTWDDVMHLIVLMGIITGVFYLFV